MLEYLLQIVFSLYCRRYPFSFAEGAKVIEGDREGSGFQGYQMRLKVHQNQYFFFIIVASNYNPFFVLSSFLNGSLFVLKIQLQIVGAPEIQTKRIERFIGFVANKQTDVQVVAGRVYIVEWAYLAADLQMLVFEEDVFGFETLLFEFAFELRMSQVFLKQWVVHYQTIKMIK